MLRISACLFCVALTLISQIVAAESDVLRPDQRILFLGDSITHAGHYISQIETQLLLNSDGKIPELINLGLPSETVSGLSEPDHPFPRPDVHERLDRALTKLKPNIVVACYGMNDGIYYPFSEARFEKYQAAINKLIEKVHAADAKLILMTPPPFDPLPLRKQGKLLPDGQDKYAWFSIYENYDNVLKKYAEWIIEQKDRVEMVIDLHMPVSEYVAAKRQTDPDFTMSGDGVHLNEEGHQILANAILKAWDVPLSEIEDATLEKLVQQKQSLLHDAYLSEVGHKRPGMKDGLPIEDALARANELDKEISDRLVRVRPRLMSIGDPAHHHTYYAASDQPGELSLSVDFYLWIPPGVESVRGIIVHQHGCGDGASKGGATAAYDLHWQALATKWDCALLGSSYDGREGVDCRAWCDARRGSAHRFVQALNDFAQSTGHPELSQAPWCLWGHSGGGFWASLMQTLHPERIVAIWLQSGTAYTRWESGEIPPVKLSPEVYQVPVVACPGFKEKTHERFHVAWEGSLEMFNAYRTHGAPFIFAPDPRTSHECGDSRYLAIPFFDECLQLRLPADPASNSLKPINLESGYLANIDGTGLSEFHKYAGDKSAAVWLPSTSFASKWREFIETGAVSDDTPPPPPTDLQISETTSGENVLTWEATADFESGISSFEIKHDNELLATVPENPIGRFGRPLFQTMSYHDTPEQPLPRSVLTFPAVIRSGQKLTVATINSVGLSSQTTSITVP